VGDIHQPLHAADNHDHGGNALQVRFPEGQTMSLHAAWDSAFVERRFGTQSDSAVAQRLVKQYAPWATVWQPKVVDLPQMQTWVREANQSAQTLVYGKLTGFACGANMEHALIVLSYDYLVPASGLIEEQLAKAGYRLAAVLNKAF
jgi:hypothetical protein